MLVIFFNRHNFFNKDLREMLHTLGTFSVSGVIFNMVVILITSITGTTNRIQDLPRFTMDKLYNTEAY